MYTINDDLSIYATRGDIVAFSVTAEDNGEPYTFKAGDLVRIKIYGKKDAESVLLQKDFPVIADAESVDIYLTKEDTKLGNVISKPKDYWYEVELNPLTNPQTIIGYDEDGARIFKLFPEGDDIEEYKPTEEDIPFVDAELDMSSTRPVENQVIARAIIGLTADFEETKAEVDKRANATDQKADETAAKLAVEKARIDTLVEHKDITVNKPLEYLDYISEETKAKVGGTITSDGVFATLNINHREANLLVGGGSMAVFVLPAECRPIDIGEIDSAHGMGYSIAYDNASDTYRLVMTAQGNYAPEEAGTVTITYALDNHELKDIRVGADGERYATAGEAVRTQFSNALSGKTTIFDYQISESSTFPYDTKIKKNTRYKVNVAYGDNVSSLDIGYTKADGKDVLLVDNAVSGKEYKFTVANDGTRFRFWTYLKENVNTDVNINLTAAGMVDRTAELESRIFENEAALCGYKARVTKDNFSVAQGFTLDTFYNITAGRKFYVSFDSFNYEAIDRLNLYCHNEDGNEIFHDALTPTIGELYECCTDKENSVLNIYLYPTATGGNVDFTMSILNEDGIGKRILFNEKSIEGIKKTQEKVGIPFYEDYSKKFTVTDAWDIEYPTENGEQYIFKADGYTGQHLKELEVYAFNSMQDYIRLKNKVQIGDTVVFTGNSAYKYFRVYAIFNEAEEQAETLSIKLAKYNKDGLIARVEALEESAEKSTPNVLILGDSYSQMGYWINQLKEIVSLGDVVNLGVSSATLKDRFTDRTKYPYNSRPVSNDTRGGNVNTFGSQVEKLKRLMAGVDLDNGESKVFANSTPDIILIEGGTNDAVDVSTDAYLSQIYTVEKGYISRKANSAPYMGYIKIPTHYENTDRTTFGGAMRYLYGVLHDMFPDAMIFFVTPCGLTYMSGGEHKYLEKGEQIKYAASLLGIPVIDWGINGRLSVCDNIVTGTGTEADPYIFDAAGAYSLDALHPSAEGARYLAMEAAKVLNAYNLADYKI